MQDHTKLTLPWTMHYGMPSCHMMPFHIFSQDNNSISSKRTETYHLMAIGFEKCWNCDCFRTYCTSSLHLAMGSKCCPLDIVFLGITLNIGLCHGNVEFGVSWITFPLIMSKSLDMYVTFHHCLHYAIVMSCAWEASSSSIVNGECPFPHIACVHSFKWSDWTMPPIIKSCLLGGGIRGFGVYGCFHQAVEL